MKISRPMSPQAALARCQDICARAEMSPHEISQKLWRWGIIPDVAERIIERLIHDRYLDTNRFAHAFVHDKLRFNHWGRIKIRQALSLHRLDTDIIKEAIGSIDEDEYTKILENVIDTKARNMSETSSFESKSKLLKFAASRGFEPSLAIDYIKSRY